MSEISIHTLRGEGDNVAYNSIEVVEIFQSTPSVGRATIIRLKMSTKPKDFNPRPPWGGRQDVPKNIPLYTCISIHALRGEGDASSPIGSAPASNFNPRPPWGGRHCDGRNDRNHQHFNPRPPWGGRHHQSRRDHQDRHFNPRPPWGGRLMPHSLLKGKLKFQSTPSVGRATESVRMRHYKAVISIHALRGEGDSSRKRN